MARRYLTCPVCQNPWIRVRWLTVGRKYQGYCDHCDTGWFTLPTTGSTTSPVIRQTSQRDMGVMI